METILLKSINLSTEMMTAEQISSAFVHKDGTIDNGNINLSGIMIVSGIALSTADMHSTKYGTPENAVTGPSLAMGCGKALGDASLAIYAKAYGKGAVAFGNKNTVASGDYSVALGDACYTIGSNTLANGTNVSAFGSQSHAEGELTKTIGERSHSEGYSTETHSSYSHSEGLNTKAYGVGSHVEGRYSQTLLECGFTKSSYTHTENESSITTNQDFTSKYANLKGKTLYSKKNYIAPDIELGVVSAVLNNENKKTKIYFNEWNDSISGTYNYFYCKEYPSYGSNVVGECAHAEGSGTKAIGVCSHSEGYQTSAIGDYSHAEGQYSKSVGNYSYANGLYSTVEGNRSYVIGNNISTDYNTTNAFVCGNSLTALSCGSSFIWNGSSNKTVENIKNAFIIRPSYGTKGFYIGDKSLHTILSGLSSDISSAIDSRMTKLENDINDILKNILGK